MKRRLSGLIVQRLCELGWAYDPPPGGESATPRRGTQAITRAGPLDSVDQTVVLGQKGSAPGGPLSAGRYRR